MNEKTDLLFTTFRGRMDRIGVKRRNSLEVHSEAQIRGYVRGHVRGTGRVGFYNLLPDSTVPWAMVEFENHGNMAVEDPTGTSHQFLEILNQAGLWGYRELSKSGRNFHVWLPFDHPIAALKARGFLMGVTQGVMDLRVEVWPKQPSAENGIGNFVWLPLFADGRNNCTVFVDENGAPLGDQWGFLADWTRISEDQVDEAIDFFDIGTSPERDGSVSQEEVSPSRMEENCVAIAALIEKVQRDHHLGHEERLLLGKIYARLDRARGHEILSECSDYDEEKTDRQLDSVQRAAFPPCMAFKEIGLCLSEKHCFEAHPPWIRQDNQWILDEKAPRKEWPQPSPVRWIYQKERETPVKNAAETGPNEDDSPYIIQDGRIGHLKMVKKGMTVFEPLCNFTAKVTEEIERDNGVEAIKTFAIEGELDDGEKLPRIEIPALQFTNMHWIVGEWGVRTRISAGQSARDRLREAVQYFSSDVINHTVYTHTGWRRMPDGQWVYLHGDGAMGTTEEVDVDLEGRLEAYRLPSKLVDLPEAVNRSLGLLDIAPYGITIPLLAGVYLAPLGEALEPDFAIWLYGPTGSLKSSLSAVFLSHYGKFERKNLPASWESTDNALERVLFTIKDAICVVDDYAPQSDPSAQLRMTRVIQRILRSQGNRSGRSRMNADLSLRPTYTPRGLLLTSGEDLPSGQSILARLLTVEVDREQIDLDRLTRTQNAIGRLPHALAGYIQWLAPQMDQLREEIPARWRAFRQEALSNKGHLRVPEVTAYLAVGLDMFLKYAQHTGVVSVDQSDRIYADGWSTLLSVAEAHQSRIQQEDPAETFLGVLGALLAQKVVYLAPKEFGIDGQEGGGEQIGWKDDDGYVYLIPEVAYRTVARFQRDSGGHFPHSKTALYRCLEKRGALIPGQDGRHPRQVKIGGKNRRVLMIEREALYDENP